MKVCGYTHDELNDIIAEHEAYEPLKGTRAWQEMLLEARHEIARKKLTEVRQEMKHITLELAKLRGEPS